MKRDGLEETACNLFWVERRPGITVGCSFPCSFLMYVVEAMSNVEAAPKARH